MRAAFENVKRIRESKGISKTFIAKKLGITVQGYSNIEYGVTSLTSERLRSISFILGEEVKIFFDDELTDLVIKNYNELCSKRVSSR